MSSPPSPPVAICKNVCEKAGFDFARSDLDISRERERERRTVCRKQEARAAIVTIVATPALVSRSHCTILHMHSPAFFLFLKTGAVKPWQAV